VRVIVTGAVAAAMLVAVAAGCGSDSSQPPEVGVGPNVGAQINLADCSDWNAATAEERLGTLEQLRNYAGGQVLGGTASRPQANTGAVLEDDRAYELLNSACQASFAQGFKLYKLYQRAAAFSGIHESEPSR
jgi:hypothetical protein